MPRGITLPEGVEPPRATMEAQVPSFWGATKTQGSVLALGIAKGGLCVASLRRDSGMWSMRSSGSDANRSSCHS